MLTPDSRNLYRNHERACPHRKDGRDYKKCHCPIWVDISFAGRRICRSLKTRNWQKAEDLLRKWEADDRLRPSETEPPPIPLLDKAPQLPGHSLEAACREFLADAAARGLREPTLYKYRLLLRRLLAFAQERGLRLVKDITLEVLREFRATLPHHNTAARKRIEELRAFFRFCQDASWITDNPAKKLQTPMEQSPPREPFTNEEVEMIRRACTIYPDGAGRTGQDNAQRLRALVELLLHTGLRIRDAAMLRRDSIVGGKMRVKTAKTGTEIYCRLPPSLIKRLEVIQGTSQEYFFWTGTSKPKSAVGDWQRALKKLFRLAGIPNGHAHRFRHTFAKTLLMEGVPPDRVAILMGHRSSAITLKHYAAWVRERQEQLEGDVRRVWAQKERPKNDEKPLKRTESAIQPLYGNTVRWLN